MTSQKNLPQTSGSYPGFALNDRAVLVLGASRGIGEAIARAFVAQGSKVMLAARNMAALNRLTEELDPSAVRVRSVHADVTDSASVEAAVAATVAAFGRLDIAVNNAGIQLSRKPLAETAIETFDEMIRVNLRGVFVAMKYEILAMLASGGGSIINVSSLAGLVGIPLISTYVAAKHGVIGLTKASALEYATQGIRVNAIVPGTVMTKLLKEGPLASPESAAKLLSRIPMDRVAPVDEIIGAVLWLASDLASYVTGIALPVDGGYSAA